MHRKSQALLHRFLGGFSGTEIAQMAHRVVIDTNVLVAGLRSRRGTSFRLLQLLGDPRWRPCLSVPVALEYEDVLKRDFAGAPAYGIQVLRPVEFLQQIGNLQ